MYVAQKLSSLSATVGKETSRGQGPVLVRQVHYIVGTHYECVKRFSIILAKCSFGDIKDSPVCARIRLCIPETPLQPVRPVGRVLASKEGHDEQWA
jgi:hypothetical protein